MWKLAIEDDEGKQTVVPLTRDEYTIGRKDGNTIRLTERNVSREHARIYKKNGDATPPPAATIILEDLTSYNGVFVNGLRVSHAQNLTHGDLVQIGDYRLVLQDEATAEAPARNSSGSGFSISMRTGKRCAMCTQFSSRLIAGTPRGRSISSSGWTAQPMPCTFARNRRPGAESR